MTGQSLNSIKIPSPPQPFICFQFCMPLVTGKWAPRQGLPHFVGLSFLPIAIQAHVPFFSLMSTAIILGAICKQLYHTWRLPWLLQVNVKVTQLIWPVSFVKVNKNTDELELSYNVNIAFGHQGCNFSSCHAILYRLFYSCKPLLTERMENQ